MTKLSKAITALLIAILLVTQPGCVTDALLKLGEPANGPREQPASYTRAVRDGRVLALEYNSMIDADGEIHSRGTSAVRIDLSTASWLPLGAVPIDPYCTPQMWARLLSNAPPQPPAPLLAGRPSHRGNIALLHQQRATGFPPMSVQLQGMDAWILCGAGDAIGVAHVPPPPPPVSGERSTGATVAIVLLFPFALAVDIAFGIFYVLIHIAR